MLVCHTFVGTLAAIRATDDCCAEYPMNARLPHGKRALFVGPIKGPAMLKRTLDQRIHRAYLRLVEARLDGAAALIEQRAAELDELLDQRIRMAAELQ